MDIENTNEKIEEIFDSADIRQLWEHYQKNKPVVDLNEFREDINRFVYVKRLLRRYKNSGELNVRLLLNHLVILYNVFDQLTTTYIIKSSSKDMHQELYSVLIFLNRIPEDYDVVYDPNIIDILERELKVAK